MTLTKLAPIPSEAPRAERSPDEYEPMQKVTRQIAFEPTGWDPERKERIAQLFETLAPEWHTRSSEERLRATRDALERGAGGASAGSIAVEIGSGTGIHTPTLLGGFDYVVSMDLVSEMLSRSPTLERNSLLLADASRMPLASASVDAIICVNAFLFPEEYARVLGPGGRVVFVSTSGDQTPIYLPPPDVVAALEPFLGPVEALSSMHGFGVWTVVSRSA